MPIAAMLSNNQIGLFLTFSAIEDTDSPFAPIMNLVPSQNWVAFCLDPDPSHGIVKYFIVFDYSQTSVVNQHSTVLSSPDFVSSYHRVASTPTIEIKTLKTPKSL